MNLICKTRGLVGTLRPRSNLIDLKNSGFNALMLDATMLCEPGEFDNLIRPGFRRDPEKVYLSEEPERLQEEAERLFLRFAREEGIETPVALAPFIPADTKRGSEVNEVLTRLAQETLRAAASAGCRSMIAHPLFVGIEPGEEWDVNRRFYLSLAKTADDMDSDIMILLTNRAKDINGHTVRGLCAEPEEACRWIDDLNVECSGRDNTRFGFCFDLGIATISGQDIYETIHPLGRRLRAVILRDCDGIHGASMLPFTACVRGQQTDWLGFIRGLRGAGFDGDLIMDFSSSSGMFTGFMRPPFLELARKVGKYFIWQIGMENTISKYDKRVLFGAGNMCRAYMKDYGDKYPPLFTCDNNSSRWGEEFCGLTIEPPEKLRELTPDTAIFICNIYYREINEQLLQMDLPNPIEWFNDEYMPTFHMDRVDMSKDPELLKARHADDEGKAIVRVTGSGGSADGSDKGGTQR